MVQVVPKAGINMRCVDMYQYFAQQDGVKTDHIGDKNNLNLKRRETKGKQRTKIQVNLILSRECLNPATNTKLPGDQLGW